MIVVVQEDAQDALVHQAVEYQKSLTVRTEGAPRRAKRSAAVI